ncbi:DUF3632 domain-containing protein [Kineosporia babensis]|uniref:DUF3632 domain-containing protein n=1 Tax=Kineosporia babensis TaxID=499548 RepID=A0A9X1NHL8_9ACTN|nr:DUF3632 domain-containing protein [Kineosporia babensis]MCD5313431.1 DUF3632 domain-containing protein [Kineosporia babensis]
MSTAQPPLTGYYRALLRSYLTTASPDVNGTAHAFATPVEKAAEPQERLWTAWGEVIRQASVRAPEDHTRLVELVVALRDRGFKPDATNPHIIWGQVLWTGLPLLNAQMREAWNWAAPPATSDYTWRNVNGFAARLTVAGVDFSLLGLWTIRSSLEESTKVTATELMAAAEWFKYLSKSLVQWSEADRQFDGPDDPASRPGKLLLDQGFARSGFSARRLAYWQHRIQQGSSQQKAV